MRAMNDANASGQCGRGTNISLLNAMSLLLAAKAASSQRADTQFNLQTRPGAPSCTSYGF
jgi:hypothetical protein